MTSQADIVASLPAHLRPFVKTQEPEQYSARDHAVWRFVMGQLQHRLEGKAHPTYFEGLARTGIALDHIPSIDEMNASLKSLGWQAVVVDGFIPPAIFMEFQSLRILVIALEMRSVEHIFYTPAPDILHESAGHAPFLIDVDYAEYLQRFGEIGMRAIASRHDEETYGAVRRLSILKENPDEDPASILAAEHRLAELAEQEVAPSEAALLTRLHWWTVEYGLVGSLDNYHLFGAGLLSSLGESQHCIDDAAVFKQSLTVNAVLTPYDITTEQPQLFVTRSCKHLTQVLETFADTMCFKRGGAESVKKAIASQSVCTAVLDSGLQISGCFSEVFEDAVGNVIYLRTAGSTQLAINDQEIFGHGIDYHADGFGAPVGGLKDFSRCLSTYTIDELKAHAIVIGEPVTLEYLSGITVSGTLMGVHRQGHRSLIFSFEDCWVRDLEGRVLFQPEWGVFDMPVGSRVDSVYGGVADRERWQLFKPELRPTAPSATPDADLMAAYEAVALLETGDTTPDPATQDAIALQLDRFPEEWLLRAGLLHSDQQGLATRARRELADLRERCPELDAEITLALDVT